MAVNSITARRTVTRLQSDVTVCGFGNVYSDLVVAFSDLPASVFAASPDC